MDVMEDEEPIDPIDDIIDYLIHADGVRFKSQQIGESDLTTGEKRAIANDIFKKGALPFLDRFGNDLKLEHLTYFEKMKDNSYEMDHRIDTLKNTLNERGKRRLIKNRRYEALSKMLKEGTYFSEVEMMERNPLLYDQLVGRYMTEKEKRERDNIDTQNITLLNVLLEGISKRQTEETLQSQKRSEGGQTSENSSESEDEEKFRNKTWGEFGDFEQKKLTKRGQKKNKEPDFITGPERSLLREEFVQEMYRSFLDGEDENFDYEGVDGNAEYDSVEVRGRDEEEKYFDTETSDIVCEEDRKPNAEEPKENGEDENVSEDELDLFMHHLNNHPSVRDVKQV